MKKKYLLYLGVNLEYGLLELEPQQNMFQYSKQKPSVDYVPVAVVGDSVDGLRRTFVFYNPLVSDSEPNFYNRIDFFEELHVINYFVKYQKSFLDIPKSEFLSPDTVIAILSVNLPVYTDMDVVKGYLNDIKSNTEK